MLTFVAIVKSKSLSKKRARPSSATPSGGPAPKKTNVQGTASKPGRGRTEEELDDEEAERIANDSDKTYDDEHDGGDEVEKSEEFFLGQALTEKRKANMLRRLEEGVRRLVRVSLCFVTNLSLI